LDAWMGSLTARMIRVPEEHAGEGYPILFLDPQTGQIEERLNFPVQRQAHSVRLEFAGSHRRSPRIRFLHRFQQDLVPIVRWAEKEMIVTAGAKAWGLKGSLEP